jgi:hypothetical protein
MNTKSEKVGDALLGRKEMKSMSWSLSNGRERTSVLQRSASSGIPPTVATLSPGADVDKPGTAVNVANEMSSAGSPSTSCDGTSAVSTASDTCGLALPTPETVVDAKVRCASQIPSQEIINKIAASSKRKSTILIPNAVPAQRERGSAVGIVVAPSPSLKSCLVSATVDKTEEKVEIQLTNESGNSSSDVKASNLEVQSSSVSSDSSNSGKPVKRKLNLLQYKSILPERRKVLAPGSCEQHAMSEVATSEMKAAGKSALSVVHFYGNCQQVGLDHDYCRREEISGAVKDKAVQLEVNSGGEQNDTCSTEAGNRSVSMQYHEPVDRECNYTKKDASDRGGFGGIHPLDNPIVDMSSSSSSSVNVVSASYNLIKHPESAIIDPSCSPSLNTNSSPVESAGDNVQIREIASAKAVSPEQFLPGLVQNMEVVAGNSQSITIESCIAQDSDLQQNNVCVGKYNELPMSENVLQWRKLKQHAHRNYRGHGPETSAKPVSPASKSCSEAPPNSATSSAVVLSETNEVTAGAGSLEDGECSPSHVTLAAINIMPVYMTSYIPNSEFQCTIDDQNLSSTMQHSFSETNSEVEFLGFGRSSRSPSPVISIGRSSRSSGCGSKKRRLRRKSISDSSSSRSRQVADYFMSCKPAC